MTSFIEACIKANEAMIIIGRKMSKAHLSFVNTKFTSVVGSYD